MQNARRNVNNLRYTDDTTLMAESKEELKSFLMKIKEESKKAGLKLNIQRGEDNPLQYSCLKNSMDRSRLQFMGLQKVGHN